ncbi:hypothetical protein A5791_00790 [Mycobacterium sp. 852002-51163_SCH5372311]|uniref:SEC-C domain-containing protein n=1 Tax=Mycobacterium sp. 852002-51163_SCH5372311 TaxID=1834097 RepID=UPI0007FF46BA|nr:SEC-C domain-containing protein [Mycobacterium sp. 852002-51163_SCH5372311]OBF91605.1 hypothetical protein A5791_00790 [Mycobacterium sp. 852002-51163_SCH5372311]
MAEPFDAKQVLARVLTEHGPLDEAEIERRLRDSGVVDPDQILRAVRIEIEFPTRQLVDDRWIWLPTLIAGRVFTHRLGADEVAHDLLRVTPDLAPITTLSEYEQYQRFADGSPAQVAMADFDDELLEQRGISDEVVGYGALLLTPGTLEGLGVAEGDVVGVRLSDDGFVVERVTAVGHGAAGERLAATLDPDEPVYFDSAVWTACVADPALFTEPLLPLCEIVDDFGLARRDEWLAPAGFDFASWEFDRGSAALARRYDLDEDDAAILYTLVQLYEQVSQIVEAVGADHVVPDAVPTAPDDAAGQDDDNPVAEVAAALADPLLAGLLVDETIGAGRGQPASLGVFAEVLEPKVARPARVACRWLRAVALERIGDIDAAERELLAAESMDPEWPLPLLDLARFASDRGDVEHGLALLRRAEASPDDPLVELLERHRSEPRRDLGRNQLCWCGSGRKYKKCHLGREQLPLAERVGWLYAKACQHTVLTEWNELLAEVAYERCRYSLEDPDDLTEAMNDPLVLDAVLFEGGVFEEFLDIRGKLLPDDERLLAQQWLLVDRSVFEVEQVRRGQSVTVRDVRTGDTHEVREATASRQLKPGQLVCARVVPAGDSMQFVGGLEPVALHERDALIDLLDTDPDPVSLVAQLSRRFVPATLTNTEGDPLAICEAIVEVTDAAEIEGLLDGTYDRVGDEPRWFEHVSTHGMSRIRATLVLEGEALRVQTNSEKRMDRVLATLARLDPDMSVLDDSRHPVRDVDEAAEMAEQFAMADEDALDPDDPEMSTVIQEFIREYETKWLDLPIPALDGQTPRQAADDPTRRGDLMKLLDSFPADAAARGGMNVGRLRAALGL